MRFKHGGVHVILNHYPFRFNCSICKTNRKSLAMSTLWQRTLTRTYIQIFSLIACNSKQSDKLRSEKLQDQESAAMKKAVRVRRLHSCIGFGACRSGLATILGANCVYS